MFALKKAITKRYCRSRRIPKDRQLVIKDFECYHLNQVEKDNIHNSPIKRKQMLEAMTEIQFNVRYIQKVDHPIYALTTTKTPGE